MRAACVTMQRNEERCLLPWLLWHGDLFGFENLYVIDHGSEHPQVRETLRQFEARGVHVVPLPATADYRSKGDLTTQICRFADAAQNYDFIIPLDCDEFVTMRDAAGRPSAAREEILCYLETLPGEVFQVSENFLNILGHRDVFFALRYAKIFFRGGHVHPLDHGLHHCLDNFPATPTRLAYVHFHHKIFARQREMSLEKLRPYAEVNDAAALAAYRGTGWHLVDHVLGTEAAYLAIMRPDHRCIVFPELNARFESLGIDADFCQK